MNMSFLVSTISLKVLHINMKFLVSTILKKILHIPSYDQLLDSADVSTSSRITVRKDQKYHQLMTLIPSCTGLNHR